MTNAARHLIPGAIAVVLLIVLACAIEQWPGLYWFWLLVPILLCPAVWDYLETVARCNAAALRAAARTWWTVWEEAQQ